jgi:hypothetical protein
MTILWSALAVAFVLAPTLIGALLWSEPLQKSGLR